MSTPLRLAFGRSGRWIFCAFVALGWSASAGAQPAIVGDFFVSEFATGSVLNIRDGGDLSGAVRFATGLDGPRGICIGPEGRVFVAEETSGEVTDITLGGDQVGKFAHAEGLDAPVDLLCDEDRILVVESAGPGQGEVTDITAGGDFTGAPSIAAGLGTPAGVMETVEGEEELPGRQFVSDPAGGRIHETTGGGVFLVVPPYADGLTTPLGLAQWVDQYLVADAGTGQVVDFTLGGDLALAAPWATLNAPTNLAPVEGLGLFATSDSDDAVYEISSGGDFTAAVPFATGVAVDGFAGIAHFRGCGDGILVSGEQCDDGNVLDGDGCSSECSIRLCLEAPDPACIPAAKGSILSSDKREGKEKLKVTMAGFDQPVSQGDFGDPVFGTTRYDICIYNQDDALIRSLIVARGFDLCGPKDVTCWKALKDKGYKYKDKDARSAGIRAISMQGGSKAGQGKVAIQGSNKAKKNQNRLPRRTPRSLEGHSRATVQLMAIDGGCFTVNLNDVKKAEENLFKARAD